jgi:hypothetical protein
MSEVRSSFSYNTSHKEFGSQILTLKRNLIAREKQGAFKWDYMVDGLKYSPKNLNEIDDLVTLVSEHTQEVRLRVYFGNSQNCTTYTYNFTASPTKQEFGINGFGDIEKYNEGMRLKWDYEHSLSEKGRMEAEIKKLKEENNSLTLSLALEEQKTSNLEKQLNAPIPKLGALANTLVNAIEEKLMSGGGGGQMHAQPQGLGGLNPEYAQHCVKVYEKIEVDFKGQEETFWQIYGYLAEPENAPYLEHFLYYIEAGYYPQIENVKAQLDTYYATKANEQAEQGQENE